MSSKLYVGNLPFSVKEDSLRELFSQVGEIESVNIITDRDTGRSKGFGFVELVSDENVDSAIEKFNGYELDGRALKVSKAKPKKGGGPRRGGFGGGGGGRNRW